MDISELQRIYAGHPNTAGLAALLEDSSVRTIFLGGLHASATPLFISSFIRENKQTFVFILGDQEEAGYFYHDLTQVNGEENILFFPSSYRRAIKYGQKDAANEILRTEVLSRLQKGDTLCVVTYPDALAEKVVSQEELTDKTLKLSVGEHVDTEFIAEVLTGYGFEHVDYVYEPGQYAVRGSIIDVFSFASEYPYRIDFFGDEVDSIRTFEVENQLSKEKKQSIAIVPELTKATDRNGVSFFEFIPKDTVLAMKDFLWVRERIQSVRDEALSPQALAAYEGEKTELMSLETKLIDGSEFAVRALEFKRIEFGNKPTGTPQATLPFDTSAQPIFHKNFDLVSSTFTDYLVPGYTLYICTDSEKQAKRLKDIFEERGDKIAFTPVNKTLHEGFSDNTLRSCFFTDHQIFDRFHKYNLRSDKARSGKVALTLKELSQFEPGDYVVHIDHGVGKFAGLVRIPNGDTTQEVIKLVYQNEDVVFVSIHSLHKISKYKGKEGETPRLNKLGTCAWEKMKERTKTKIKDIARDLIKLYSQRKQEKGFSYTPDSFLQHELEASFIYEDTPDQLKTTQDVKADMESERPMDRLVCGDVGFGKTEVAMRAAFKAVNDHKQVAILVPTTVLAQQHYTNFKERFNDFPINIEVLSRFKSKSEQKTILEKLKKGQVDIIIGTHRLLSKDVEFSDLGLIVIDEEQRFGVKHKEKLKELKTKVDVLTLTATPIPRTLHMSMLGIRDLSIIETAPTNRYPVQTYVMETNPGLIREAILREMDRGGQIFYVYNRVETIDQKVSELHELVPEARIGFVHGQMSEVMLENTLLDFLNGDYDVLVATTIIETGIDISNVNTLFIENADHMGLSTLYQLRGRVGRSNRIAYAYLMYRPDKVLTEVSEKRLDAIKGFTELGSGFKIAMRDLSIRGAGNILGASQSGFIDSVGFEMYSQLLEEAINKRQGKTQVRRKGNAEFNLQIDAYLPSDYISDERQKIEIYKRIREIENQKDYQDLQDELIDRFGEYPDQVAYLIEIGLVKAYLDAAFAELVERKNDTIIVRFEKASLKFFLTQDYFEAISKTHLKAKISDNQGKVEITFDVRNKKDYEILEELKIFGQTFMEIKERKEKKEA